jgi:hypothetical protein
MRRDLFHYFEADVKTVYNAYIQAIKEKFGKDCEAEAYHTISFGLNASLKYNMNGGACHVHLIPYRTGTAVAVRYTIVQLVGARYEAHYWDLNNVISRIIQVPPTKLENADMAGFLRIENRLYPDGRRQSTPVTPPPQPVQSAPVPQMNIADEIKKYKDLMDCGAITPEEYERIKRQILGI